MLIVIVDIVIWILYAAIPVCAVILILTDRNIVRKTWYKDGYGGKMPTGSAPTGKQMNIMIGVPCIMVVMVVLIVMLGFLKRDLQNGMLPDSVHSFSSEPFNK